MLNPAYIIHTCPDLDALSQTGADYWLAQAQQSIAQRGYFYVALTGGATPQALYRLLAEPRRASQLDWSRIHLFMGDERYVPQNHPDSNFGMARRCFLDHIPIPPANLHPVPTDHPQAESAASTYAALLAQLIPDGGVGIPQFDLIMLGMGEDGHTASLFPETEILAEQTKTVAAVYVPKLAGWRISMTYPSLNQARQIMVLVSGANKAAVLAHVLQQGSAKRYPIQGVEPVGEMHWFIDQAAAAGLSESQAGP